MESSKQSDALALFKDILGKPDDYWDPLAEVTNKDGSSQKGWRKVGMEGAPATSFQLKMITTLPGAAPDQVFALASDVENRASWDERWKEVQILSDAHGGKVAHVKLEKPPIPFVS